MSVLARPVPPVPAALDEHAARRSLREQIERLERELVTVATTRRPRLPLPGPPGGCRTGPAGPRVLALGELEATRDDLAGRLHELRRRRGALDEHHAAARRLLEQMLVDPARHRWVRVTAEDLGEAGCTSWHVRPRLGLLGMLAGWWQVKVSSGCPLRQVPHRDRRRSAYPPV